MDIPSDDVLRLIQQFLLENGLNQTLDTLKQESGVFLNIGDKEALGSLIVEGKWDAVLSALTELDVPNIKLLDLYQQIVLELCELDQVPTARSLLRQSDPMMILRDSFPDRYLMLEGLLQNFDGLLAYPTSKLEERKRISVNLCNELLVVDKHRLVTLLGQSLKWQLSQGAIQEESAFDIFRGSIIEAKEEEDTPPSRVFKTIKFPKTQCCESAVFSNDAQYFVTGTKDGFIEVWDYMTGQIRKDLEFQKQENMMMMDTAVLCLCFDSANLLCSGSQAGKLKIWNVTSGVCLKTINAHTKGVTCVAFSSDSSQIMSSSFDHTIRLFGLKTGQCLKEYRGHTSWVNSFIFLQDMIVSGSSDGSVKMWNTHTAACMHTLHLNNGMLVKSSTNLSSITHIRSMGAHILIGNKSSVVYVISTSGGIVRTYTKDKVKDTVAVTLSGHMDYIYCATMDSKIICYNVKKGTVAAEFEMASGEIMDLVQHPFSNILAVLVDNGQLGLLR